MSKDPWTDADPAGSTVDISRSVRRQQIDPAGHTARVVDESVVLVVTGETKIDDDTVFGLIRHYPEQAP